MSHNQVYQMLCPIRNQKEQGSFKLIVDKKVRPCMFYLLKRESNHTLKNSHTCTVVSIPAESRITRAVEQSLCICTSGIVPTAVVGILSTLINVCNEINSMICATMIVGRQWKNIHLFKKIMKKNWSKRQQRLLIKFSRQ